MLAKRALNSRCPAFHHLPSPAARAAEASAAINDQIEAHDTKVRTEAALIARLRTIVQSLAQSATRHPALTDRRVNRVLSDHLHLSADTDPFSGGDLLGVARLIVLTNLYADYVPSRRWCYLDLNASDCHGWITPDGGLVVDVVTTMRTTELDEAADQYTLFHAARRARRNSAVTFGGLRHIVLDAPYESTWRPAHGEPQPLHTAHPDAVGVSTVEEGA